jgi:TolB protein
MTRIFKQGVTAMCRLLPISLLSASAFAQSGTLGIFTTSGDVGNPAIKGSTEFSNGQYRITGSGANIWAKQDQFQYVWREMTGDFTVNATLHFLGKGADHRKAGIMVRQNLDTDATYADVVIHGNGMPGLQWRSKPGEDTNAFDVPFDGPGTFNVKMVRTGVKMYMFIGKDGAAPKEIAHTEVTFRNAVLVGLVVCSHQADASDTVVFSDVSVVGAPLAPTAARPPQPQYRSRISIYDTRDKSIRTVYQADTVFEAPNWTSDGKFLLVNSGGKLYRISAESPDARPEAIDIDSTLRLNNDHAPSWDGKYIAFSASSPTSRQSQVYLANADGSNAHLMVTTTPSYFHGWSPDGKYLAYVYQHPAANGVPANYDIFRIPAAGGESEQLDSNAGYDDGPDYSPDGKWIYFNSDRSGNWDIWRIPADGAGPGDQRAEQVTGDEREDWFPHPSPDGKWLLFLSFAKGTATHNDKLPGTALRIMPMPGTQVTKPAQIEVVTTFFGGQGTINVNSWAPDSKRFAFVIYEPLAATGAGR